MSMDTARLYLITPPISDFAGFAPQFEAALAACEAACVLLRTNARDDGERKKIIRALAPIAQARGVACRPRNPAVVRSTGRDAASSPEHSGRR